MGGGGGAPAPADKYLGVSYLMSAADVSPECVSKYGSKRADRCLRRPAHHMSSLKFLGFSDTEEVKYRNAHLSH